MPATTDTVSISLPKTLIADLKRLAQEKDQSYSRYLMRVLQAHVDSVKQQSKAKQEEC